MAYFFYLVAAAYDLTRFSVQVEVDVLRTHPLVILGGVARETPFVPPAEFLGARGAHA